jgi:HlyD family secretion protein
MSRRLPQYIVAVATAAGLWACEPTDGNHRLVGQLESDRVEISAEFAEPIIERAVIEGQAVEPGQLLIRQDTARIEARIAEAEAAVAEARARYDELTRGPRREQIVAAEARVVGAVNELQYRETDLQRAIDLFERELASPEQRDRAQAARDAARANLENLEAKLDELLSGTTIEELRQAEAAVRQAESRVDALKIDRDRLSALAPSAGIVDSLLFEPGERPTPGQPMAILLTGKQAYARVYVPEALRVQTRPGTAATVHVDGIPQPLEGVVRWVSSESTFTPYFALTEDDRGRLSFQAKVDIVDHSERLPDGVPVEVKLAIGDDGR